MKQKPPSNMLSQFESRSGTGPESEVKTFGQISSHPVIDAHMHVFPDELFKAIWNWFDTHAWKIKHQKSSDELIEYQFELGARGLVLLTYAHKPGMARGLNRYMAGLTQRHQGVVGLGTVHPDDPDAVDLLTQAFDEYGLAGCKIHCHVIGRAMDEPAFFPIYQNCLEHDKWLLIHAGTQPADEASYGMDVTTISGVDRVEAVLMRYPDLKLIIPHLGFDQTEDFYPLLPKYPNLYLDTTMVLADYFPVQVSEQKLIENSSRIMYGSDFPNIPYEVTREVEHIVGRDLGEKATGDILYRTAAELFGL